MKKQSTFGPHVNDPTERKAHKERRRMAITSDMTMPELMKFQNRLFHKEEAKRLF